MRTSRFTPIVLAGTVVAMLGAFASVPAGASTGSVPQKVVEAQTAKVLAQETGHKADPPKVTCPGDLVGKVGATITCTLTPAGSKLVYPVTVTVNSTKGGTAHFAVQVGQATGVANKVKFCQDNATLDHLSAPARTFAQLVAILKANEATISDFQSTAPADIVVSAGRLVQAARDAVTTGKQSTFVNTKVETAGKKVDAYCGQNSDGTPIGSPAASTTPG